MLSICYFVFALLLLSAKSEKIDASTEEETTESFIAGSVIANALLPNSFNSTLIIKTTPLHTTHFKSLHNVLGKMESINRMLEQKHNLTIRQLNQFVQSKHLELAIKLYITYAYPRTIKQIMHASFNSFIDSLKQNNGSASIKASDITTAQKRIANSNNKENGKWTVPAKGCSFILRNTNDSLLADKLDTKNSQQNKYLALTKDGKCPLLFNNYLYPLKVVDQKGNKIKQQMSAFFSKLASADEFANSQTNNTNDMGEDAITIPNELVDVLNTTYSYNAYVFEFVQHLNTSRSFNSEELNVNVNIVNISGHSFADRFQDSFAVLYDFAKDKITAEQIIELFETFHQEMTDDIELTINEKFEQLFKKKARKINKMKAFIIYQSSKVPTLKITNDDNLTVSLKLKNSTGPLDKISMPLIVPDFMGDVLASVLKNENSEEKELRDELQELFEHQRPHKHRRNNRKNAPKRHRSNRNRKRDATSDQPEQTPLLSDTFMNQIHVLSSIDQEPTYQLQSIINCTYSNFNETFNSTAENTLEVYCQNNYKSLFDAYNITEAEIEQTFSDVDKKEFLASVFLYLINTMTIAFDEMLNEEYLFIVSQVEGKAIEQIKRIENIPDLESIYVHFNSSSDKVQGLPVDYSISVVENLLRLKKRQFDMPSLDSVDSIKRRITYNLWKPVIDPLLLPVRMMYVYMRLGLMYEAEQPKIEIFRQMNEHFRCFVHKRFQRAHFKVIRAVAPDAPKKEFSCSEE